MQRVPGDFHFGEQEDPEGQRDKNASFGKVQLLSLPKGSNRNQIDRRKGCKLIGALPVREGHIKEQRGKGQVLEAYSSRRRDDRGNARHSTWLSNDVSRREWAKRTDRGWDSIPVGSRMFLGYQLIGSASHIQDIISLLPELFLECPCVATHPLL